MIRFCLVRLSRLSTFSLLLTPTASFLPNSCSPPYTPIISTGIGDAHAFRLLAYNFAGVTKAKAKDEWPPRQITLITRVVSLPPSVEGLGTYRHGSWVVTEQTRTDALCMITLFLFLHDSQGKLT
jgi:hypothetical protein